MEQQELHLTVNGEDHTLACDPDLPLLDVLLHLNSNRSVPALFS